MIECLTETIDWNFIICKFELKKSRINILIILIIIWKKIEITKVKPELGFIYEFKAEINENGK